SENHKLRQLFSLLPPQYASWLEDTRLRGRSDFLFTFKGRYNAVTGQQPDLGFKLKVRKGLIEYAKAPFPFSDFKMDIDVQLPELDTGKLIVNLKQLDFKVGDNDYFNAFLISKGLDEIQVKAKIKSDLDLK